MNPNQQQNQPYNPYAQPNSQPGQMPAAQPYQEAQQGLTIDQQNGEGRNIFSPPQQNPQIPIQPIGVAGGGNMGGPEQNSSNQPSPNCKTSKLLIFGLILAALLAITFIIMTIVFYGEMDKYKNNTQAIINVEVENAKKAQKEQLDEEFIEKEKEPYLTYDSPAQASAVKIVYPKTWDLYAVEDSGKGTVDNYFAQNMVKDVNNKENIYALRVQVVDKRYSDVVSSLDTKASRGEVKISPFVASNVEGSDQGIRVEGEMRKAGSSVIQGSMIILPVRDKTIQIWTEGDSFTKDFDEVVLKNLKFNP